MRIPQRSADLFPFLFDTRVPILFLVGALTIAVIGNAAYDLIGDVFGKTRVALALIMAGGLLLILFVVLMLKALAKIILNRTTARIGGSQAFSVTRKAIIFTVGKQSDTIELCLHHQTPDMVGFVCTTGSEFYADNIIRSFGFSADRCFKRIVDPWNVSDVRENTLQVLSWVRSNSVQPEHIAFDVTGGLTTMSVGAFIVAEENRIDSQYVRSDYDENGKRLTHTEEAIFIRRYGGPPVE